MLYLVIALYLAFLSFHYDFGRPPTRNFRELHRWLTLLVLVLVSGLRYRLSLDTVSYMHQFESDVIPVQELTLNYFFSARYQPVWVLLNSICKTFDSFVMLQTIVAWIFNYCIFYFFKNVTNKFFTAILLYYLTSYFYFNMDIMRESIAVAFFLIAMLQYAKNRLMLCLFWIFMAAMCHQYAMILFFVPVFLTEKIPNLVKICFIFCVFIFVSSIENPVLYLASFGGFLTDLGLSMYDIQAELTEFGLAYQLLRIIPIVVVLIWFRGREISSLQIDKRIMFSICWLYVVAVLVRIYTLPFADRITNYFIFFVIGVLVSGVSEIYDRKPFFRLRKSMMLSTSVVSFLFYIAPMTLPDPFRGGVPGYRMYYPYSSIFSKETDPDREYMIVMDGRE